MFTFRRMLRCVVAVLLVGFGLSNNLACGASLVPVHQVSGARLEPWDGRVLSEAEVRQIIVRGLARRRFQVLREEPNVVFAHIVSGPHEAQVRIDYNAAGYAISYVDSSPGLKYDGHNIHKRYNHWVRGLDEAIRSEFRFYEKLPPAAQTAPAPTTVPDEPLPEQTTPTPGLAPVAPAPSAR